MGILGLDLACSIFRINSFIEFLNYLFTDLTFFRLVFHPFILLLLDFLASGETIPAILENYPGLVEDDIYACIAYGAEMFRERLVDIAIAV
jgi:hypothetical protein